MVQFHAKLSPLTPHHRHTLMLQNQQRWLKTEDQKMDILMIWSSMRLRQCETVAHEQLWPDISMRGDAGGARSLSAPHWAECADDGRISTNLLPAQLSPAQPSQAPLWGMRRHHLQCGSAVFNVVRDQILCRKSHYLWEISRRPSRCFCPN